MVAELKQQEELEDMAILVNSMYKIEETNGRLTLYRRILWILWFAVESKKFIYPQHRGNIIRRWKRKYGEKNFGE